MQLERYSTRNRLRNLFQLYYLHVIMLSIYSSVRCPLSLCYRYSGARKMTGDMTVEYMLQLYITMFLMFLDNNSSYSIKLPSA